MAGWLPIVGRARSHPEREHAACNADFRPLPFLGNRHVQTLLGSFSSGVGPRLATCQRHVRLPDGDCLVVHDSEPDRPPPIRRTVLLVHGLGGCHRSGYMVRLAGLLGSYGMRVVRLDLRGCGSGVALARKTYNSACSDDIRAVLAEIRTWDPAGSLMVIGFSLGGNIALKLAGEAAQNPIPGLERVAAVAPPIDLIRCANLLALPRNRFYDRYFATVLAGQVRLHRRHFPELPPVLFPRRLTVRVFDEIYTAPQGGFADAFDYYRRASAFPLIAQIAVPTLIVAARDDPFVAVEPFEMLAGSPAVQVQIVERGGHCGFLGWDGVGGIRWVERRVANWVLQPIAVAR